MSKEREDFVRIAMAIIKKDYTFRPQRLAIASKMYSRWVERNKMIIDIRSNKELCYEWIRENRHDLNQHSVDEIIDSLKKLADVINGDLDFAIGQNPSRGEFISIRDYDKEILDSLNPDDCSLTGVCWDYDVISGMQKNDLPSVLKALHKESEYVYSDDGLNELCEANEQIFEKWNKNQNK